MTPRSFQEVLESVVVTKRNSEPQVLVGGYPDVLLVAEALPDVLPVVQVQQGRTAKNVF